MARTVPGRQEKKAAVPDVEELDSPLGDDDNFWEARPMLTYIRDLAWARRVSPWALLGTTMAYAVTATSYRVVLPPLVGGHGSINLAVGLVGAPGAGKGAAMAVAQDLVPFEVNKAGIGSGEGVAHLYAQRSGKEVKRTSQEALLYVAEIDTLRGMIQRQGSTILPELRKAWSGEALGFAYADPKKNLPIKEHTYRFAIVAGIQPGRADTLLDDETGGTPQRFIWLPAEDPDAPDERPDEPAEQTIDYLKRDKPPVPDLDDPEAMDDYLDKILADPQWEPMEVSQNIRDEVDADRLTRLRGEAEDPLDGHAMLSKLKVAAALAIICGSSDKITDEDWDLAERVMAVSDFTRQQVIDETGRARRDKNRRKGEADADRAALIQRRLESERLGRNVAKIDKRVKKLYDERGREKFTKRDLRDAVGSRPEDRELFEEALEVILENGILVKEDGWYWLP